MVAAVVVLFNPVVDVVRNINSYLSCVEKLYVIDNSDTCNEILFQSLIVHNTVEYVFNNGNLGIAKALNIGCQRAIDDGMEWVLTMDQDSKFLNLIPEVVSSVEHAENSPVVLYYPNYLIGGIPYDKYIIENNEPIVVMTSGNFINLKAYQTLAGFEDKLFIDYVDIDYCLRIKAAGYKIALLPGATLVHELGDSKYINFLSLQAIVTNHSSLRRYYITRNRLYVLKKYKTLSAVFTKTEERIFINDLLKIILFEDYKISKLKNIVRGYLDYRNNKFGKYNQ